jgi:hypothetical protein
MFCLSGPVRPQIDRQAICSENACALQAEWGGKKRLAILPRQYLARRNAVEFHGARLNAVACGVSSM